MATVNRAAWRTVLQAARAVLLGTVADDRAAGHRQLTVPQAGSAITEFGRPLYASQGAAMYSTIEAPVASVTLIDTS